jgi:DNA-directed RNA polymerase subunit F
MSAKTHEEPLLQPEEKKEVEPELLTVEQVNACLEKIENMHPLKDAEMKSVYPFLQRFSCCKNK